MRTPLSLLAICLLAVACDTGDGTTLTPPPEELADVPDVPIGTLAPADDATGETLASVPIDAEQVPEGDAATLPAPAGLGTFELIAPWPDGAAIDPRYGCDGSNAAPPLAWNEVPDGTAELAVALVNLSDLSRGRPFVHWVVTGIDPALPGLAENETPPGSQPALNFFGNVGYDGPCPPPGDTAVFALTLFALNQQAEVAEGTPAAEVLDTIDQLAFEEVTVTGSSTR